MYYLLFISMSLTICTYLLARTTRGCIIYDKFPSKYLVNNKYILAYLLFPKYKVTKWLFTLHISQLVLCIPILVIYIIYWINQSTFYIINSKYTCFTFVIYFFIFYVPISIIHGAMSQKYLYGRKKQ